MHFVIVHHLTSNISPARIVTEQTGATYTVVSSDSYRPYPNMANQKFELNLNQNFKGRKLIFP